jgi:hypothetical protein
MENYNRASGLPKAVKIIAAIEDKILATPESQTLQGQIASILNHSKFFPFF